MTATLSYSRPLYYRGSGGSSPIPTAAALLLSFVAVSVHVSISRKGQRQETAKRFIDRLWLTAEELARFRDAMGGGPGVVAAAQATDGSADAPAPAASLVATSDAPGELPPPAPRLGI